MGRKLLIALILSSFLLAGTAMAVKRVPKSGNVPTEARQTPSQDKQVPSPGDKAIPPPTGNGQDQKDRDTSQPPQAGPQHPNGGSDRFIDRDGDGINDNLKKPPETIKRRDNDRPRERPQKAPERQKPRSETERQKPQGDQRSR